MLSWHHLDLRFLARPAKRCAPPLCRAYVRQQVAMPPRPSAQAAAAASCASFASLPHALALRVFALLPVDERARCACVSRGWCATVADGSLWQRLDLSPAGGVARERVTDAFLLGLAARAAGHAQALHVSECLQLTPEALLAAVTLLAANGGALRELRVYRRYTTDPDPDFIPALVQAAPLLRVLEADVVCEHEDAGRILRNEPPFLPLRVRQLEVLFRPDDFEVYDFLDDENVANVHAFAAALISCDHASLTSVVLKDAAVSTAAAAEAVADAALAKRLTSVDFVGCFVCAESAPALARMLRGGFLTFLSICGDDEYELLEADGDAVTLLANALRASTALTALDLDDVGVFGARAVLDALVAHPTLRTMRLYNNDVNNDVNVAAAGGLALSALIAADAPALRELHFPCCFLGDAAMGRIADALAHNTHLQVLDCRSANMSEVFVRTRLLPALRANTSLQRVDELVEMVALPAALLQECMSAVAAAR